MSKEKSQLDFSDKCKFKGMVGWFDVPVLIDAAKRAVISSTFGQYADKRVTHATYVELKNQ